MTEEELSADNAAIGVVGPGTAFTILEGEALQPYLDALKATQDGGGAGARPRTPASPFRMAHPNSGLRCRALSDSCQSLRLDNLSEGRSALQCFAGSTRAI